MSAGRDARHRRFFKCGNYVPKGIQKHILSVKHSILFRRVPRRWSLCAPGARPLGAPDHWVLCPPGRSSVRRVPRKLRILLCKAPPESGVLYLRIPLILRIPPLIARRSELRGGFLSSFPVRDFRAEKPVLKNPPPPYYVPIWINGGILK